jgi:hypothetical protein
LTNRNTVIAKQRSALSACGSRQFFASQRVTRVVLPSHIAEGKFMQVWIRCPRPWLAAFLVTATGVALAHEGDQPVNRINNPVNFRRLLFGEQEPIIVVLWGARISARTAVLGIAAGSKM